MYKIDLEPILEKIDSMTIDELEKTIISAYNSTMDEKQKKELVQKAEARKEMKINAFNSSFVEFEIIQHTD